MQQRNMRWSSRHALAVLAAVFLLTLCALAALWDREGGGVRLSVDPSLDALVAAGSPSRLYYEQLRRRYGNDEGVLVMLSAEDIYTEDVVRRVAALSDALAELPGVVKVNSLTTVPLVSAADGQIHIETVDPETLDAAGLRRLRAQVQANPLLAGNLVSTDGRATALDVRLDALSDREMLDQGIAERIRDTAYQAAGQGVSVAVAGAPLIREATSRTVVSQMRWMLPAIVLLLSVMLALTFRSVRGVLLPLATIAIVLTWTLAAAAVFGIALNLITSLVPPLLITMGLAYCAHVLCEYEALAREIKDPDERISHLLDEIPGPVTLTAATTAIGLVALAFNFLPAIRQFALLSAVGVLFTALLVLSFLPACLRLFARAAPRPLPGDSWFEKGSRWFGRFDISHRRAILAVSALVCAVAAVFGAQVRTGDRFIGVFKPEAPVRADYDRVNQGIGGVNPLLIALDGPPEAFLQPENLQAVARLQQWLRAQPEVGAATSVVDHVRLLSATLGGAKLEIPQSEALVRQLLFFGDGEAIGALLSSDRSSTLLSLRLRSDDTSEIAALLARLQPELKKLPRSIEARVSGNAALLTESVQTVTGDQMLSIALALALIFLCLSAQFGSLRIGLLASLPTFLQTALYFGALGAFGIQLNATTSLVECLVLGLAVDDTIHYLARFSRVAKRKGSEEQAAVLALTAVLRPITMTKAMLALGFLVLITGELENQVLFGWLAAFTLAAAWLVDVFVTPAFMSGVRVVSLWDSLLLNLGKDVQSTIPLFAGLSNRQARIFALMSRIEPAYAGELVLKQGDPAGDIYVVIDGKLEIWAEHDGKRIDIGTVGRGAVIGENGYFGQQRTANVEALTKVRLLRFDDADQERICEQYPRIAARVFLNLNKIQAERRRAPRD